MGIDEPIPPKVEAVKNAILRKGGGDDQLEDTLQAGYNKQRLLEHVVEDNRHAAHMAAMQQGWLGRIIGSGEDKSGNIAFLVIILCLMLIVIYGIKFSYSSIDSFESFMKFTSALFSIITGALGYLFGTKRR